MVFFIPWRVVAEESGAAHYGFGGAMLLDVADFHFSDIPVRGDDGARAIGATDDAAAAAAAVELRGRRRHTPDRKPTPPTPGATLRYLPKYSPDLNPIEQAFSKLKAHLRKATERTIPRLSRRIGDLVAAFSPQQCAARAQQLAMPVIGLLQIGGPPPMTLRDSVRA
jgi:transposase